MLLPIIVPIIAAFSGLVPAPGEPAGARLVPASRQPLDQPVTSHAGDLNARPSDTSQNSGITGTVYVLSGNQMPAPNRKKSPGRGIRATVCIFRLTSESQVVQVDPTHYRTILTPLVRQVETDEKGRFQVHLPPGTYSVFTKKGQLFYASRRDEKNHIAPVEVLPGKMTQVTCSVESDQKVVY